MLYEQQHSPWKQRAARALSAEAAGGVIALTGHCCSVLPLALCPCPQTVVDLLQGLPVMYLVHRTGPTSFVVREDGAEVKRKISIGARMCCSW